MFVMPKVSQKQAENIFSRKKSFFPLISKFFPRKKILSPERLEIIYLPFYLFDVLVKKESKGKNEGDTTKQNVTLSVDGLLGHAVLYAGEALAIEKNPEKRVPTCDFAISSSDAAKTALDRYKGILLEHGLRTRSHPRAEEMSEEKLIHHPFWIGYFKKKKGYDFKALDAVSGEIQGVRMRRVFIKALKSLKQRV
jgi:hypothetical protein